MAHLTIIKTLNRDSIAGGADAQLKFDQIEEFLHTVGDGNPKAAPVLAAIDALADQINDWNADFNGAVNSILAMCE